MQISWSLGGAKPTRLARAELATALSHLASVPTDFMEQLMQKPAGRKLKHLDLFYIPIISAVGASLPGINSLVFGGHDCQWMNQEPLA